ncbi:MAG: adenylate/guanylate cyclase domain-containing protein [Cellulomonadaceae bacterium]|jgi:adenylate cyclase|nr:adenylate/guanylate cyclase domain-containing protein [Cellulomonadaceae bacterium]
MSAQGGRGGQASIGNLAEVVRLDRQIDAIVLGGPTKYTLEDLAELSGASVEECQNIMRWIGEPTTRVTERRWTQEDVETIKDVKKFAVSEQVDEANMAAMLRGLGATMERFALRHVEAIIQHLAINENLSDTDARLRGAKFAPSRAEVMESLMLHVWRRHYAAATHRLTTEALAQRGVHSDDENFPLVRVVGFADLVGFTSRTESFDTREFTELIHLFTDTAWDIITVRRGRVINMIGDAVFWVASDVHIGAEIALALAQPDALVDGWQVRVGLEWTRVLSAYGDIFGPGVNLAARLTQVAPPGEVFVGPAAALLLSRASGFTVTEQPAFLAKGIGLVHPAKVTYEEDPKNYIS